MATSVSATAVRSREYSAAKALLEEAAGDPADPADAFLKGTALTYLGRLALAWGECEEAREPLDRALDVIADARPSALISPLVARAQLARAEGDGELAGRLLGHAVELAHAGADGSARALLAMGDFEAERGDLVGAHRSYEQALELARADDSPGQKAQALDGLARIARAEGASQQASRFRTEALRLRHEHREGRGIVESLEATGRLGQSTDRALQAARLFGAASAVRELPALTPPEAGSEGRPSDADWRAAGARYGGTRGERSMADGWETLTEREQEVAALVAQGMTNKGIAERLVITPGTVKNHLSHIYTKLDMATRSELADEVWRRRRGAIDDDLEPPGTGL